VEMLAHPAPAPAHDVPGGPDALPSWRGVHGRTGHLAHADRLYAVVLQKPGSAVNAQSSLGVALLCCAPLLLRTASPVGLLPARHVVLNGLTVWIRLYVATLPDSTTLGRGRTEPPSRELCDAAARALPGVRALLGAWLRHDSPVSSGNIAQP